MELCWAQCISSEQAVGDWIGPNTFAHVVRAIAEADSDLAVHVAMDLQVALDEMPHQKGPWKPLLLFVPMRLGLNGLNPTYQEPLKAVFRHANTVGMIGGKPNSAFYFVGTQGDDILYLDPHFTQPAVDMTIRNFSLQVRSGNKEESIGIGLGVVKRQCKKDSRTMGGRMEY